MCFKRLFGKKKENTPEREPVIQENALPEAPDPYSGVLFYVFLDDEIYGPFTFEQIKEYPLLEDTLVTTNTLGGEWYKAKCFECFEEMFNPHLGFRIAEDGTIIRD